MEFRIADSFIDSLCRLTNDEQKAAKTSVFDLQLNPANPSLSFHRINRCKDPNFWSIRSSRDIRIIVHKTESSMLVAYVHHHDAAYEWAERRKIEVHPKTGAAQIVEIRETVKEIVIPKYVEEKESPKPPLMAGVTEEDLLSVGVPPEWIDDVMNVNEESVFAVVDHLPSEAAEALLEFAAGCRPTIRAEEPEYAMVAESAEDYASDTPVDPFAHPDAARRFRTIDTPEALELALESPWEKWAVFLHPDQETLVARSYNGPARVSGSAGTGKTVVALHRAVHLLNANTDASVLLTTFSESLIRALGRSRQSLRRR